MKELGPKARALLERTSPMYEPSAVDRDRLRAALRGRLGLAAGTAGAAALSGALASKASVLPAAGTAAGAATKINLGALVIKALAAMIVVSSVAGTTIVLTRATPAPYAPFAAQTSLTSAAPAGRTATPAVVVVPLAMPLPTATEVPAAVRQESKPVVTVRSMPSGRIAPAPIPTRLDHARGPDVTETTPDPIDAEMALLREAQIALREQRGADALAALDAHARRFPNGALTEERAAARVVALCQVGRIAEGTRAQGMFLTTHPASPQTERVRRACDDPSAN